MSEGEEGESNLSYCELIFNVTFFYLFIRMRKIICSK